MDTSVNLDLKAFWREALILIEPKVGKMNFKTWFKNTAVLDISKGKVVIGIPTEIAKEYLQGRHHDVITEALKTITPNLEKIIYKVDGTLLERKNERRIPIDAISRVVEDRQRQEQAKGVSVQEGITAAPINPKYNLDNFIVGDANRLAHAACLAVAARPGRAYNPLFVYGGVGLGKTHLLQGTANTILKKKTGRVVAYTTSEKLTIEIVDAIKGGMKAIDKFRKTYRAVDALLIDDIQFIAGKEKTQEEFFHTFNVLHEAGKQIVLSSDRPPKEIVRLEERLRSRFESGMIVDIGMPDFETRIAILQEQCKLRGAFIDNDVLEFIAYNASNSIRELLGVLTQVIAQVELLPNYKPTVESVGALMEKTGTVKRAIAVGRRDISALGIDDVIAVVAEYYGISGRDMIGASRKQEVRLPRQIAMYIAKTELHQSYQKLGEAFGGKNHTTVIHAVEKIREETNDKNSTLRNDLRILRQKLISGA